MPMPDDSARGTPRALSYAVGLAVVAAVTCFFTDGLGGLLLLYLAVLPIVLILFGLRISHEKDISVSLYTEMFLSGCILSIFLATILEGTAQALTLPIWRCERSTCFTWQCDVAFVVVVTVAVGLSEEASKIIPLSRLKRRARYLPSCFYFRVADTPYAICLAGCASAAGFACIENIKYVMKTGRDDLEYGIDTSLFRAGLAIPFHVACTGYASAKFARRGFKVLDDSADEQGFWSHLRALIHPTQPQVPDTHYHLLHHGESADFISGNSEDFRGSSTLVYEGGSLWDTLKLLSIPMLCHGLYDSGLFLAAQFMAAGVRADRQRKDLEDLIKMPRPFLALAATNWPMTNRIMAIAKDDLLPRSPPVVDPLKAYEVASEQVEFYFTLGLISTLVSLASYLTILGLFVKQWISLAKFQRSAIPMLHRHFDIPN